MRLKYFLIALLVSLPLWWGLNTLQKNLESYFYAQISQPFQDIAKIKIPQLYKNNLNLQTKAAALIKVNRFGKQRVLFKKNISQTLPIASLTKLMTAVIILENPKNYDLENSQITISKIAASQENVPIYGNLKEGEKFKVRQLLDIMLIYSSNDAAFALSEKIKTKNFVEKMNQKAKTLGLENSHFQNPTGLDPENLTYNSDTVGYFNHSSARDLIKLARYILKRHPLIFATTLKEGKYKKENIISKLKLPQGQFPLGEKTGYTDEAGYCLLLVLGDKKGNQFINVILGAPSSLARVEEMQKLINHVGNF